MDYDELVAKVIELLQREKRVPYRVLKRRFDLDDDYIEDLKIDLIEAKQLAVDENDRILVWISEAATTPKPAPTQPAQVESPPIESRTQEAERRQLTVMFCDLVGSTSLSGELDPEDLREVVRSYQAACTEVIQRYEGHVAQLLGDGLLVYFGYPSAHEDDAQRSVYTGLSIIKAIETLNSRLEQDKGIRLAIRIGIHTGLVVVGEMGGVGRQEQLALGETPNIAARIQGLAEPDMVVISAATHQLIEAYFNCETLGEQVLRGAAERIAVYRVLQESGAQSRLDIASTRGLTPLVGRGQEVGLLLERWNQVKDGQGQVVLLSGEGGIGKTRAVQTLKDHVANEPHTRWECRGSPYFTNSALYPVIDLFQRMLRFQADDTPEQRLEKLEQELSQYRLPLAESVPLFAPLLSLSMSEDRYPPLTWTPQRQRQKTLESIVAILLEQAEWQSVLFILEDLHWADPTSLELLDLLIDQAPTASICILLSCRPTFQPPWSSRSYLTQMTLKRLSRNQIERVAEHVAGGKKLPSEVLQQIVEKTDGVPLFVEEMTKAILESGALKDIDGQYELSGPLTSLNIPATLQDSLMARLDRLVTAKAVVQYAAVLGRRFSYELLQVVSQLDEAMLQRELSRLVEAELVYQRGLPPQATYTFKHALIQDTAYQSLLRSTRQRYHRRIAEVLTERFPETVETQPELLAYHFTEAGLREQAVGYWQQAGEKAIQRSANAEAISHLNKGLELLKMLPDTSERTLQELTLQCHFGVALIATKGFAAPEVEHAYARARELCQHVEDAQQVFPVVFGLWGHYHTAADLQTARELAEQLLTLAQHQNDPAFLLQGHRALGDTLNRLGEFVLACQHLEQGIALYDRQQHRSHALLYGQDPGMGCLGFAALVLWMLGYPEQSLRRSDEALSVAQDVAHPFSLAFALNLAGRLHALRREWRVMQERAETLITLATKQENSFHLTSGMTMRACALTMEHATEEGITHIRQAIAAQRAIGTKGAFPWLALLVEAYGKVGQMKEGLMELVDALPLMDVTGERWYQAEARRLKGELLLSQSSDNSAEAESCFQQAIAIAQNQSAKSWELRAAISLARLWQSQRKHKKAYDLLAPVYGWFTEGFDTADLQDAKALLDDLERSQ
jgi:class 3 adenylate cyclase/predicted ATPase